LINICCWLGNVTAHTPLTRLRIIDAQVIVHYGLHGMTGGGTIIGVSTSRIGDSVTIIGVLDFFVVSFSFLSLCSLLTVLDSFSILIFGSLTVFGSFSFFIFGSLIAFDVFSFLALGSSVPT
jgi:hypothetical protein